MRRRYNPRYYESAVPRHYDEYEKRFYPNQYPQPPKLYGALDFLGDLVMLMLTGGLWFIWIFVREMRRRHVRTY
jgi:hypothetical protein